MIDPEAIFDQTFAEMMRALNEMKKTKDLHQRKTQSEILKNLSESLGVFITMTNVMNEDASDFMDDDV